MLRLFAISHCLLLISNKVLSANETEVFAISTKGCTIRQFPLFSETIKNLVQPTQITTRNCSEHNKLLEANSTHIWTIENSFDIFNIRSVDEFYCCYRNFKSENVLQNITYGDCVEFKTITAAKHEFVRVKCYYKDDQIYEDFFVFKNMQRYKLKAIGNNYNVLIFGIESVSRMNFYRTMARTAEYLQRKGSIDFLGYNKVGDNSYPNLFPLLMGHNFQYVKNTCFDKHVTGENKVCTFIWDNFKKAGYLTALGSDSIAGLLGEYEYNLTNIPTDFYLQTVMYEARHIFKNKHYNYHQCLGSKYFYKILLNYIEGLAESLKSNRLFGMFWEESVSHEHLNNPYIMDEDYFQLLTTLEESGYLNETIVIFLSDHGMRWGEIVHTEQGKLEERLPLFQVLFPKSFKLRYKLAFKNFRSNRLRLTTPYDIYHTLLDIIDPAKLQDKKIKKRSKSNKSLHQSSLFLSVSKKRTCESVAIEEHWCACNKGRKLKVGNLFRIQAAQFLINHVNILLRDYPQCQNLTLSRILEATMVKTGKVWVYNVVLETQPGEAIFDGTMLREEYTWTVSGTVSRLNRYQNDSCVDDDSVRIYCCCQ